MTKIGGHVPGSSARCDQCKRRRKKCDLSEPQCRRCQRSGLRCSGPRSPAVFVHRHAESFNAHTQRTALVQAYQHRSGTANHSQQFFRTTMLWIQYLRCLLAEHQWSSSLAVNQNARLFSQASYNSVYQALLSEFKPRSQGIFSGDRMKGTGPKHYSSVAICIRSLLPLSSLRITAIDYSLLSLLSLYYGSLHGDTGLQKLAYSSYIVALGQYSRLLARFLSKDTKVSSQPYQVFTYISISMQMFEHLRTAVTQSTEYQLHVNGALSALQHCGPQLLRTSLEIQKAFCGLREFAVFAAIERREQTFLAEPDWLNMPFENVDKSMRDHLTDVGVHIPGLLRHSDTFFARIPAGYSPQSFEAGISLLARATDLQHKLEAWLALLKMTASQPLYWSRNSPVIYGNENHDAECMPKYSNTFHQLCFLSGPIAGLLVHHWSFVLQLSMVSIELQESLLNYVDPGPEQVVSRETLFQGLRRERTLADSTAQLILEAEPYLSCCFEGFVSLQSPLRIVASYFKKLNASLS